MSQTGFTPDATVICNSATNAASILAPALPAVAGKTNYVTGFDISGGGATGASVITAVLSGPTNSLNYIINVIAGATGPGDAQETIMQVRFPQPIPASAVNTAITLTVPSFGSGNNAAAANIYGFVV